MSAPEVLSGLRAPRSVRMDEMRAPRPDAPALPTDGASGVTVYVSRYPGYRVQITAPQIYTNSDGRKYSSGKLLAAQFVDGVFRNNSRDPATRALIDEALQSNPYFGPFGSTAHYWLSTDQAAKTEAARIASALAVLKTLPKEAVDQFVGALRPGEAADHDLGAEGGTQPPPPAAPKGTRPIPPRG